MKIHIVTVLCLIGLYSPQNIRAEANEAHGPHAGSVATAGKMLIEVVPHKNGVMAAYALTPNWLDVALDGYTITGHIEKPGAQPANVTCVRKDIKFDCVMPPDADLSGTRGTVLVMKLIKGGKEQGTAFYRLPLKSPAL